MSAIGGEADVIGVKADIASLAGRPGLRRRRNRLASGYIWPYSAISALRLPRGTPNPRIALLGRLHRPAESKHGDENRNSNDNSADRHPQERDEPSAGVINTQAPEAARVG